MNRKSLLSVGAAALALTASLTLFVQGSDKTYDPENDPFISLSYLSGVFAPTYDSKIAALDNKITALDSKITALESRLTELEKLHAESDTTAPEDTEAPEDTAIPEDTVAPPVDTAAPSEETAEPAVESYKYEVICLKKGEKLLAKSPLEIILRSGSAIIVSITANGVNDLTDGNELMNAQYVTLYHELLVPRGDDGRGIQVTSEEAYIMVRGEYETVE